MKHRKLFLRGLFGAGLITATAFLAVPSDASAAAKPRIVLTVTNPSALVIRNEAGYTDLSDVAMFIDAPNAKFEIRAHKKYGGNVSYDLVEHIGATTKVRSLTTGLGAQNFDGLNNFFQAEILDTDNHVKVNKALTFCPNSYWVARINASGPTTPTFPLECNTWSHWTKGMVFGIDKGWSTDALQYPDASMFDSLPDGDYTLRLTISRPWREALQLPFATSRSQTRVHLLTEASGCDNGCATTTRAKSAGPALHTMSSTQGHKVLTAARNKNTAVDRATVPDLAALPAAGIQTSNEQGRDYLNFGATVWNAGASPIVVEGFRRSGEATMDAYQYFYKDGRPVSAQLVGEMEYDRRESHRHWHFKDFAAYELTDASKTTIERSGKEAFCLAPTDAIDLLGKGADLRPFSTGLGTACGDVSSRWIREVLQAGWGDTYAQFRAGQSFDITDLPNGTYFVKTIANPEQRLVETRSDNNVAYRKVLLGGEPGSRTATVPPYRGMDTEGGSEGGAGRMMTLHRH